MAPGVSLIVQELSNLNCSVECDLMQQSFNKVFETVLPCCGTSRSRHDELKLCTLQVSPHDSSAS